MRFSELFKGFDEEDNEEVLVAFDGIEFDEDDKDLEMPAESFHWRFLVLARMLADDRIIQNSVSVDDFKEWYKPVADMIPVKDVETLQNLVLGLLGDFKKENLGVLKEYQDKKNLVETKNGFRLEKYKVYKKVRTAIKFMANLKHIFIEWGDIDDILEITEKEKIRFEKRKFQTPELKKKIIQVLKEFEKELKTFKLKDFSNKELKKKAKFFVAEYKHTDEILTKMYDEDEVMIFEEEAEGIIFYRFEKDNGDYCYKDKPAKLLKKARDEREAEEQKKEREGVSWEKGPVYIEILQRLLESKKPVKFDCKYKEAIKVLYEKEYVGMRINKTGVICSLIKKEGVGNRDQLYATGEAFAQRLVNLYERDKKKAYATIAFLSGEPPTGQVAKCIAQKISRSVEKRDHETITMGDIARDIAQWIPLRSSRHLTKEIPEILKNIEIQDNLSTFARSRLQRWFTKKR